MAIATPKTALLLGFSLLSAVFFAEPGQAQKAGISQAVSASTPTADPMVPRPRTQPIKVPLFRGLTFSDFSPKAFSYTPPPRVQPWAKVILVADFSVSAGRQFDRTAQISVGRANVYFGTTPEPSADLSPAWHVERDLTDYTALFRTAQTGRVDLGNLVNSTYTGVIRGSAYLLFYPADRLSPAPETPDVVLPLSDTTGGAASLASTTSVLAETFTFPTNVVRASLDVITQSQGADEFWYTSVPDSLAKPLQAPGGTAFREAQLTVDDRPAGVAPVYPWIYTGGIDPSLWRPLPGVQTLNLVPYRVDLTPFAGVLSDGHPHRIGLRVYNAGDHFLATGVLLLYRDARASQISGAITEDTLTASPSPVIRQDITTDDKGAANGTISVSSARQFTISGYVQTPRGRIETRIAQTVRFSNRQEYLSSARESMQMIRQDSVVSAVTTTRDGGGVRERRQEFDYPLTLATTGFTGNDKAVVQALTACQGYHRREQVLQNHHPVFSSVLTDQVSPSDITSFDEAGRFTGHHGQKSSQFYFYDDSLGGHYHRSLAAADGRLTSFSKKD